MRRLPSARMRLHHHQKNTFIPFTSSWSSRVWHEKSNLSLNQKLQNAPRTVLLTSFGETTFSLLWTIRSRSSKAVDEKPYHLSDASFLKRRLFVALYFNDSWNDVLKNECAHFLSADSIRTFSFITRNSILLVTHVIYNEQRRCLFRQKLCLLKMWLRLTET